MSGIFKCPKCNRSLIAEEFFSHRCAGEVTDITYDWFVNTEIDEIGKVLLVKGIDGTLYRILPSRKKRMRSPDESYHSDKDDQNDDKFPEPSWFWELIVGSSGCNFRRMILHICAV